MTTEWAVVFATLVGPILAVWAAEYRQERRDEKRKREDVLFTLMGTRGNRVSPEHIAALNRIDVLFHEGKYPKVVDYWRMYSRHLNDQQMVSENLFAWHQRTNDLFAQLLHEMGRALGIEYSLDAIKNMGYYPMALANEGAQNAEMRTLFIQLIRSALNQQAPRVPPASSGSTPPVSSGGD